MEILRKENIDLEERIEKYNIIMNDNNDKVVQLKMEMKSMRGGITRYKDETEEWAKANEKCQKELKKKNKGLETTLIQYSKLERENFELNEKIEVIEKEKETLQSTIN